MENKLLFCFVDESESNESDSHYHILAGVLIPSEHLFEASQEIEELKKKYGLNNLKETRKNEKFKHDDKIKITKELVILLIKFNVIFIAIIEISNTRIDDQNKRRTIYYDSVQLLSERVTLYSHKNQRKWFFIADALSYRQYKLKELKKKINSNIRESNTFKHKIGDYLFETPFFVEDDFSNFIQVADLVALSLNNGLKKYGGKNGFPIGTDIKNDTLKNYSEYLEIYWPLFDKSCGGAIDGYGIKFWWDNTKTQI